MKIELTKEEIGIINEMCFGELIEKSRQLDLRFIDKAQIESYIEKIKVIMDKTCIDK